MNKLNHWRHLLLCFCTYLHLFTEVCKEAIETQYLDNDCEMSMTLFVLEQKLRRSFSSDGKHLNNNLQ